MPEPDTISRTSEQELPELRRFLVEGFGGDASAVCFDERVLHWKYFLPIGSSGESRSLIVRHEGKIVGHIGMCPRELYVPGKGRVSTVHFIDWLASREHPLVGVTLMMQGCETAQTQYGVGGSAQGRAMLGQLGYEQVGSVGDYVRVISPGYRLRQGGGVRKYAAAMRDAGRMLLRREAEPSIEFRLEKVERFTEAIEPLTHVESGCIYPIRTRELLNYYLQFPPGNISGWTICEKSHPIGFALLGVFMDEGVRAGRIIDCFPALTARENWHAVVWALVRELKSRDVEIISCYASSPWLREGLESCGFYLQRELPLTLRDGEGLVPRNLPFHLTRLEGDYAYL
jgi:hypothetical protein